MPLLSYHHCCVAGFILGSEAYFSALISVVVEFGQKDGNWLKVFEGRQVVAVLH